MHHQVRFSARDTGQYPAARTLLGAESRPLYGVGNGAAVQLSHASSAGSVATRAWDVDALCFCGLQNAAALGARKLQRCAACDQANAKLRLMRLHKVFLHITKINQGLL